jgi:hypothetical protein
MSLRLVPDATPEAVEALRRKLAEELVREMPEMTRAEWLELFTAIHAELSAAAAVARSRIRLCEDAAAADAGVSRV